MRIEKERLAAQLELERERIRFQDEIHAARVAREREKQRKEMDNAAALAAMNLAQNIAERDQAYRDALYADPRIARLQILDMSHPLDVENVFVRVRLHQETKPSYELDSTLLAAESQRDPNELLRINRLHLEHRTSSALDPEEGIRTYKHCVFVGDPGAGKTTLLKYLTVKAAEKQLIGLPDLPIYIELNAFASSGYHDLLDFASTRWDDRYGFPQSDARAYMEERLTNGNALLLLDALDETVIGNSPDEAEASYKRVADAIAQVATRYHRASIVVTARKAGYRQRSRLIGFTELEVLDFRPEDIEQFVRNWFDCSPKLHEYANAVDLNIKLVRNPRLQALAANPLLLSLIVIVYEDHLDLPNRRAELYRQCVDTLLTKWDASRDIRRRREFKPEHKRQLLEEVAWSFHNQGRRYFPESDLLSIIEGFLPAVDLPTVQSIRVLEEIAAENGLLKEQARHWYGFLHLTLQEYFVAQQVTANRQREELLTHLDDPWWEEILLLYAGLIPDASLLLQQLLGQDSDILIREDIFYTRLILAGRCLAARPTIRQISLRELIISHLFEELTLTPYSFNMERIAETLAEIGGTEVNARLMHLLADEKLHQSVRWSIARALGKLGERTVASQLMQLLADEKLHQSVRQSIIDALGKLGERTVALQLMQLLTDDKLNARTRQSIARVLGELGERTVAPQLVQLLTDDKLGKGLHRSIIYALGKLGEQTVAPQLVQLLTDDKLDKDVRRSIAMALGELGERTVAPQLVQLLTDDKLDMRVLRSIAMALGELGERTIAPQLVQLLTDNKLDMDVLRSIVWALGKLGERTIAPQLVQLLTNEKLSEDLRQSIASVLGELGERTAAPQLMQLLTDEKLSEGLRKSIARALGILAFDEESVLALASLLQTSTIADTIHRILWTVSHRARISVFLMVEHEGQEIKVIKW